MDRITTKIRTSRATIADVARLAGVSIKTVSRVTNKEPNVRETTRIRVQHAVKELDYIPNPSARGLASRRSYLVGLLYDNPSASYLISVQEGALRASRAAGFDVVIHPCDYQADNLQQEIEMMVKQSKVDGLVLTPPLSDMTKLIETLDALQVSYVRVAPADTYDPARSVYTNDAAACAEMTRYLHSLGHDRIGFIVGHPDHRAVLNRFEGFKQGMVDCGLNIDKKLIAQGYNSFESGVGCAQKLLALKPMPTAIFASNDDMAAGVIRVAHQMGLSIPGDLSVVGFDDVPLARQIWPPLTTIRQPMKAMAAVATELLLQNMGTDTATELTEHLIKSELMIRESTGPISSKS